VAAAPTEEPRSARSALVVPLRLPIGLARLREREVENARLGVPPHVTILSPFIAIDQLNRRVSATVGEIVGRTKAFDVDVVAVRRWPPSDFGPGVVWLEPEPAEPFVGLTRAIWAAYPDCPPYGREDDDLQAHITIAVDDPTRFDAVETEAARSVPFQRRVTTVSLLAEGPDGRWRTRRRFALGG
jgi:hypothetical protein